VTLTAADVAEIMRLVEESGFDELNLEVEGLKISLKRGSAGNAGSLPSAVGAAGASASALPASAEASRERAPDADAAGRPAPVLPVRGQQAGAATAGPGIQDVPSPLLGTFYRAPKPGAPPYVEVGSRVEKDTVVAIIEVMKLMNTVRAGVNGTVAQILAQDGSLVEFGEALLRIKAD